MANLWNLGGLSVWELLRRTARESWQDSVFGHGSRMAFYQFLALFPTLLLLLTLLTHVPRAGESFERLLQDVSAQFLPSQAAHLLAEMKVELGSRQSSASNLLVVVAGALWASFNATWAMIYGLNRAYEVEERRSWRRLGLTIAGLTTSFGLSTLVTFFLVFGGRELGVSERVGTSAWHGVEWCALVVSLSISFALLYRFAPNLRRHRWCWSTPGAVCATMLWLAATFAARIYFDRLDDYSRTYGRLNGVVMLLLWLYVTNGAILIGGEMNSEIEKAADGAHLAAERSGGAE